MAKSLLTDKQKIFLDFFKQASSLNQSFYFTGGTCLSEFYLQHRFSEDLDFFSEIEELLKLARIKFDWHIDYLQFGANLLEVLKLKDDPILRDKKVTFTQVNDFFQNEAMKFEKKILS